MKILRTLRQPLLLAALLALAAGTASANPIVVVTPTPGNPTQSGNDLLAAYNGITGNAWGNRYLVLLEPGVYNLGNQNLVMKPWVSLAGSGVDATFVYGNGNTDSAGLNRGLIEGASDAELRDLTARVYPATDRQILIPVYLSSANTRISNVRTQAFSGEDECGGIFGVNSSSYIDGVETRSSCPGNAWGMWFEGLNARPTILRADIVASSSPNNAFGMVVRNDAAPVEIRDSKIIAGNGGLAFGLSLNAGVAAPAATTAIINSTIIGRNAAINSRGIYSNGPHNTTLNLYNSIVQGIGGGVFNYGILHELSNSTIAFENGLVEGSTNTVRAASGAIQVGSSRMFGGPVDGSVTCAGVYDENATFFANTCP